jgi:2-desacetyl-2-hydroxyethyl bacteriochlorophyllide A dehydrogenase
MECIVIQKPKDLKLSTCDIPEPGPGDILIKVMASGICGTDIHIFNGEYTGSYPVFPGHEFAGIVEGVGKRVKRFKPGDRVAVEPNIACDNCSQCLNNRHNFCENWQAMGVTLPGGMEQFVVAPEKAVFDIGEIPFEHGAFMEPLSCVIHGVERVSMKIGDKVAILGAGPIGNLLLQMARLQGATSISILEKNPGRGELAYEMGADSVFDRIEDLPENAFDIVVDATGVLPLMARTIDFVKHGGRVLLFGVPPAGKKLEFEAFKIFEKGLTLLSSFTSLRNSFQAINLLQSKQINVKPLISHRLPLKNISKAFEMIEKHDPAVKKVMMLPNG